MLTIVCGLTREYLVKANIELKRYRIVAGLLAMLTIVCDVVAFTGPHGRAQPGGTYIYTYICICSG